MQEGIFGKSFDSLRSSRRDASIGPENVKEITTLNLTPRKLDFEESARKDHKNMFEYDGAEKTSFPLRIGKD